MIIPYSIAIYDDENELLLIKWVKIIGSKQYVKDPINFAIVNGNEILMSSFDWKGIFLVLIKAHNLLLYVLLQKKSIDDIWNISPTPRAKTAKLAFASTLAFVNRYEHNNMKRSLPASSNTWEYDASSISFEPKKYPFIIADILVKGIINNEAIIHASVFELNKISLEIKSLNNKRRNIKKRESNTIIVKAE